MSKTSHDMTKGSIMRHLIAYAIPMILGNILQLTYNAVDSIIIGKCLGESSLAAVSTSNPIMTIMILGASGVGMGASVIISRLYGSGDHKALKREFATTVIFGLFFSLAVFLFGLMLTRPILTWIKTPQDIMGEATSYLRIMFVGFLFTFQYNIFSNAMRGIGDSKTPVVFLGISCVINVLLDLLFVAALGLGVIGAGLATVIAEAISVIACVIYIRHKIELLHLERKDLKIDKGLLSKTLSIGSLTALQQAAQPVGKVFIQSAINEQGVVAMGAFNAVCRVDDFACIPAQSIGSGIMTCTAQNRGAGNAKRVRESIRWGLITALCYFPIICAAILIFKLPLMRVLTPDGSDAMIDMGVKYLAVKAWILVLACIVNAIQGYFRGMAKMSVVLFSTVLQISIRAVCVFILVPKIGIIGEAWGCMIGWTAQMIFEYVYYFVTRSKMEAAIS